MILQAIPHTGRIVRYRHPMTRKQGARSNAGELQQLRRVDRAAAQQDFPMRANRTRYACLRVFDRDRAPPLEVYAGRERAGNHLQVCPPARRTQVGHRATHAPAMACARMIVARAFLRRAIEVVVGRNARLRRGRDERITEPVFVRKIAHGKRAVRSVIGVPAMLVIL